MLRWFVVVMLAVHGVIHVLGFIKGLDLMPVTQLTQPIGRGAAVLWLVAALASLLSAVLLGAGVRQWWLVALPSVLLSQGLIIASWSDAKFGSIANLITLIPIVVAAADLRPTSLHSIYNRLTRQALQAAPTVDVIHEADLQPLPRLVQNYLRRAGVVGKPRVYNLRARFEGEIRANPDGAWMPFRAEQYNFFEPPARHFFLEAEQLGIPFDSLHIFSGPNATMQVRVAGLVEVVDARGEKMNQSETVTMFNDMCVLAPAALVDAAVAWHELDAHTVRASFTHADHTIHARLRFDDAGDLVGFVSEDRYQSADGQTYRLLPWSTPLADYRDFGGVRLAAHGEAQWIESTGASPYGRFELREIVYNLAP